MTGAKADPVGDWADRQRTRPGRNNCVFATNRIDAEPAPWCSRRQWDMAPRSRRPVTRAINNQFDCNGLPNATKKVSRSGLFVRPMFGGRPDEPVASRNQ